MLKSSEVNDFFSRYENKFNIKPGLIKVFRPQEKFNWKEIERNFEILFDEDEDN